MLSRFSPPRRTRPRRRHGRARLSLAAAWLCCAPVFAAVTAPVAVPSAKIPVENLGFVPPASFFTPYRIPSATLDFLDANHLLFTFHIAKLMRREKDDPPEDQDQTVRALVLSVPEGKVVSEGTWRLHDRDHYLWVLHDGHFLLRQRNTLYLGDRTLKLSTWLHPEGALANVQLSPDGETLVAQFATPEKVYDANGNRLTAAPALGDAAPDFADSGKDYSLLVVNTRTNKARRGGHLERPVVLPMVAGGYLGVRQGNGKLWQVTLNSFGGDQSVIAQVSSPCQPAVTSLSEQAFLVKTCLPFSSDHLAGAYNLQGHKLWEQVWQSRFAWGTFAYSLAGNRFAYSSIEVNHDLATLDPIDTASIVGQPVGVFNLETGKLDAVMDAKPILTAGDNYALSPDGNTFAILRSGAIEIYRLAPLAPPAPPSAQAAR